MREGNAMPEKDAVTRLAASLGRNLTERQADLLTTYLSLLVHWRRKINLVGPSDWPTILSTLVIDSWHLADFLSGSAAGTIPGDTPLCLLDFGAGAGLPGIPLRLFDERGEYMLLEARAKRAIFLGEAVDRLGLPATRIMEGRVEETVPTILAAHPDAFFLCLSRAFAPWPQFLTICHELVHAPKAVVTMTGEVAGQAPDLPAGWRVAAQADYPVAGKKRYLTLFTPTQQPEEQCSR